MIEGINIDTNPLLPAEQPRMKLSRDVPVSDEFRKEFDAWLADFFGYEGVAYIISTPGMPSLGSWFEQRLNGPSQEFIVMNPKNAALIKERL